MPGSEISGRFCTDASWLWDEAHAGPTMGDFQLGTLALAGSGRLALFFAHNRVFRRRRSEPACQSGMDRAAAHSDQRWPA